MRVHMCDLSCVFRIKAMFPMLMLCYFLLNSKHLLTGLDYNPAILSPVCVCLFEVHNQVSLHIGKHWESSLNTRLCTNFHRCSWPGTWVFTDGHGWENKVEMVRRKCHLQQRREELKGWILKVPFWGYGYIYIIIKRQSLHPGCHEANAVCRVLA